MKKTFQLTADDIRHLRRYGSRWDTERLARHFGVSDNTLLRAMRRAGLPSPGEMKRKLWARKRRQFRRLYGTMSYAEISRRIGGVSLALLAHWACQEGMAHTPIGRAYVHRTYQANMRRSCHAPEAQRRAAATMKRMRLMERWRALAGEPQRTRLKVVGMSKRFVKARAALVRTYGYIYSTDEHTLLYDAHTIRPKGRRYPEAFYTEKYGIRFAAADD